MQVVMHILGTLILFLIVLISYNISTFSQKYLQKYQSESRRDNVCSNDSSFCWIFTFFWLPTGFLKPR